MLFKQNPQKNKKNKISLCYWFPHDGMPCNKPNIKGGVWCLTHLIKVYKQIGKEIPEELLKIAEKEEEVDLI